MYFDSMNSLESIIEKKNEKFPDLEVSLVYIESPANPTNSVVDIQKSKDLANYFSTKKKKVYVAIDNTFMGPVFSHPILLRLYNLLFQKTLFESKCIYTAKGGFGIPIRKFFEIPAAGCLMICSPPNSFKELGFEHNVNYINAEPSGLNEALEYWLDNPKAQAIANAGQQLIKQKHSLSSRGDQIEKCIRAMVSGNYKGSHWRDGEFIIDYLEKK